MRSKLIAIIIIAASVFSYDAGAKDAFNEKLLELQERQHNELMVQWEKGGKKQVEKGVHLKLTDSEVLEIRKFITENEEFSIKDFRKFTQLYWASRFLLGKLNQKYSAGERRNDYAGVRDKKDKENYHLIRKIMKKWKLRDYYLCKGKDEKLVKQSAKKVNILKQKRAALVKKDKRARYSDEVMRISEEIIKECKFEDGSVYNLLGKYRMRGERAKFNHLMLSVIEDDQINYDYMYAWGLKLSSTFISYYLDLLQAVNRYKAPILFTKKEVRFIAESVLTKHKEVFDFKGDYYYSSQEQSVHEYNFFDGVQSLVNLSMWLKHYSLDELNGKFIETFLRNEKVISILRNRRDDDGFKEIFEYLNK